MQPQSRLTPASDQFSDNTVVDSILRSMQMKSYQPEDLRSDRFGYNPGWRDMTMPAVLSGMQTGRVEPGKLTIFKTGPISVQNWSVDAQDPGPPVLPGELLAGQQIINLLAHYDSLGFRELEALRAMNAPEAVSIFTAVHPPLQKGVQEQVIEPCIYNLSACASCRASFLAAVSTEADTIPALTLERLKESNGMGRAHMQNLWNSWITELASRQAGGNRAALGALTEDHLYVMRQLHQRTPNEVEFQKINQSTSGLKDAIDRQTEALAMLIGGKKDGEEQREARDAAAEARITQLAIELAETQRQMAEQQARFQEWFNAQSSKEKKK